MTSETLIQLTRRNPLLVAAIAMVIAAQTSLAQKISHDRASYPLEIRTGIQANEENDFIVAYQEWIELANVPWIMVMFGDYDLGTDSYVEFISNASGEVQRIDGVTSKDWKQHSAHLAGDLVNFVLYVAPGDSGVFFNIDHIVTAMTLEKQPDASGPIATICGNTDDRIASSDPRVGRINGCTAWLVSTGVVLTAGHCTNSNGEITGTIEFNVPLSLNSGVTNMASLADQYPVIPNSTSFRDNGTGDDWAIFRIGGAADNSGRNAFIEQGFFRMTTYVPPADATMRVTGYGLDNRPAGNGAAGAACCDTNSDDQCEFNCNSSSRTLQTATGRFDELSGNTLEYEVDTMPGNSGGPVIWKTSGLAVGIHTAGGCGDIFVGDENHGTYFGRPSLSSALDAYLGTNTVFVDDSNVATIQVGTALAPARSVIYGAALATSGDTLLIASGNYSGNEGNVGALGADGKTLRLTTNTGTAIIGN